MNLIKPWCKRTVMVACLLPVAQQGLERVQLQPSDLPNITVRSVIQRSSNLWVCMVSFRHCGDRRTPISLQTFPQRAKRSKFSERRPKQTERTPCPGLSPAQILLCQSWDGWERRPLVIIEFGLEFSVMLPSLKYTVLGARWGKTRNQIDFWALGKSFTYIAPTPTKIRHLTNKRLT